MWLPIALGGYFLNSVAALIDKILLKSSFPNPRVYAFFIGILGLAAFVLAPWGFGAASFSILAASAFAGASFLIALIAFFTALRRGEASRVVPLAGSIQPIGIYLLAYVFLGERLTLSQIAAFVLLLAGGVLIGSGGVSADKKKGWIAPAVLGGAFFAIFYTLTKYIFLNEEFVNGFLWPRIFTAVFALTLLLEKNTRAAIFSHRKNFSTGAYGAFLFGQASGSASFILVQYAISLASATLVNALQGSQYAFVFLLTSGVSIVFPKFLKESLRPSVIIGKIVALGLIGSAIAILSLI